MLSVLTKIQDGRWMGPNGEKNSRSGRERDQKQRPQKKKVESVFGEKKRIDGKIFRSGSEAKKKVP